MSAPVDVLSVIDCAAETFVRMKGAAANAKLVNCQRDALVNARAQVAELIEAADAYHKARNIQQRVDSSARLVAALASVRGSE